MIRRPYAISIPGAPPTCCTRITAAAIPATSAAVPAMLRVSFTTGASMNTALIAASTMSSFSAPCVPTAGTSSNEKHRAPRIAPPVFAA